MNTKIRKLFGLAACCCSLFCVSASADWTLEEVLVEINRTYGYKDIIEERDLEKYGVLETAKEILREENERADREIDIVSKCWKAYKQACLASLSRPGFLPTRPTKTEEEAKNEALERAVQRIYEIYLEA